MVGKILRHVGRNAVAYVALFVALSGSAVAAIRLPANSVGTNELRNRAVTGRKVRLHALTGANIKASSLGTAVLANGAVTNRKLASPALSVNPGTGLIGGGQIALGGSGTLSVDQRTIQHRVTGACSSGSALSSINQDGSVGCQAIDASAVASTVNSSTANNWTTVATVTIDAPGPGSVFVDGDFSAQTTSPSCSPCYADVRVVADGGASFSSAEQASLGDGSTNVIVTTLSQRWLFHVSAGAHTFDLQRDLVPSGAPVVILNPTLVGIYLPA